MKLNRAVKLNTPRYLEPSNPSTTSLPSSQAMSPQVNLTVLLNRLDEVEQPDHVLDDAPLTRPPSRVAVAPVVDGEHVVAQLRQLAAQATPVESRTIAVVAVRVNDDRAAVVDLEVALEVLLYWAG